jgi:hypothetical protein
VEEAVVVAAALVVVAAAAAVVAAAAAAAAVRRSRNSCLPGLAVASITISRQRYSRAASTCNRTS